MKQLQETFDALLPTDAQEEKMLREILIARDGAPRRHMRGNPVRMAALTAAALTLCVATASAAKTLGVSQMIRDYFQKKEEVSVMDKLNVAASGLSAATADGWKFTVTDLFGDQNRVLLGVTLEAPAGTTLDQPDYRLLLSTSGTPHTLPPEELERYLAAEKRFGEGNYSRLGYLQNDLWSAEQVADDDPTDNKIAFVFDQRMEYYEDGITVDFCFDKLYCGSADGGEETLVKEFDAKISNVATRFSSNGYHLTPNTVLKAFGGEVSVSNLDFTPLSVSFALSGEYVQKYFFDIYDLEWTECYGTLSKMRPERQARFQSWRMSLQQVDPVTHELKPMEEKPVSDWTEKEWYGWTDAWTLDTPLVLHYKDGTSQELNLFEYGNEAASSTKDADHKTLLASYRFEKPLDMDKIDYITICDVRISLPASVVQ